jgi:hypothetical protein
MEKLKEFGSQTPLGRPGQPAELASIYVQLAANDASYATGQVYGSPEAPDFPKGWPVDLGNCSCAITFTIQNKLYIEDRCIFEQPAPLLCHLNK